MTVLDIGCGPGFFSVDIARMVGSTGRVIAADLQEGMLAKVKEKIHGTELEGRITLHKCRQDKIGVSESIDFALAFYIVHEVTNQAEFFSEIKSILKPNGRLLVVEPPFHVSTKAFEETIEKARAVGLVLIKRPKVFLSKSALMKKNQQ